MNAILISTILSALAVTRAIANVDDGRADNNILIKSFGQIGNLSFEFHVVLAAPSLEDKFLVGLYEDQSCHVVMALDLGQQENDRLFFVTEGFPIQITDAVAKELASTPFALSKFVTAAGWEQLSVQLSFNVSENESGLMVTDFSVANDCEWPYSVGTETKYITGAEKSSIVLHRLSAPRKKLYKLDCDLKGPGEVEIWTNYEALIPNIYSDRDDQGFIEYSKPAIVLKSQVHTDSKPKSEILPGVMAISTRSAFEYFLSVREGRIEAQTAIDLFEKALEQSMANSEVH